MKSSRSNPNGRSVSLVSKVPPSAMVGGTALDRTLYYLYLVIYHGTEANIDNTAKQYLETALRLLIAKGIEDSEIFDTSGNFKRSFLRRVL
jgi:hypothetical protein